MWRAGQRTQEHMALKTLGWLHREFERYAAVPQRHASKLRLAVRRQTWKIRQRVKGMGTSGQALD